MSEGVSQDAGALQDRPGKDGAREAPSQARPATGPRHERLTALLVGLMGVVAALLVFLEAGASHDGARAEAAAARMTAEVTTRLNMSAVPLDFSLGKSQEASLLAIKATSRQTVSMETADLAGEAIATAEASAWGRLVTIALEMGAIPDASSPLDDYARSTLASTADEIAALLEERDRQRQFADAASQRSTNAVLGLSLAALAGILAGLAAVVGHGRSGGSLLSLGYLLAGGAVVMGAISAGRVPLP